MLHVREHRSVLANAEARKNANVITAVMNHLKEHETVFYTTEPALLALMGQQPPQAPPPPELAGPGAGLPGASDAAGAPDVAKPPGNPEVGMPAKEPSLPTNPATGQTYSPVDGGGVVNR
jgi:hypothetical protein